eukprot:CAMPEP_0115724538 /NCGR_PEP_ID=MMETSP0272-20121206/80832_1 /TAXON_ID=71861 /ORGANISM="Scrippsiella trochoidea, Strain CCMP3099" /LENGTH=130 /DNA_ID=CAMNT_0003167769 /DNA_START=70 /DNA_END=459 /DNA_ORIENTATION=-
MGQAAVGVACTSVETCSSVGGGGKETISAAGPQSLREKTYVTARADADTAIPVSVRSQAPTARGSPRFEVAADLAEGGEPRSAATKAAMPAGGPALVQAARALPAVPENESPAARPATGGTPCALPPEGL